MTDTKRLRELAEAVLNLKPDFCGGNWRTHYDYEKAANPQAIIALLEELEAARQLAQYYAVHWGNCPKGRALGVECICGVEKLLEKVTHE